MKQNLRVSLGAVVLALATLAAMIFALLNFDQRARFEGPDDGVAWLDTDHGVQAWQVAPNSPASRAGIRVGDHLAAINGAPVTSAVQVTKRLWRASLWTQLRYKLTRNGEEFETPLVTAPAEKPASKWSRNRLCSSNDRHCCPCTYASRTSLPAHRRAH